MKYGSLIRLTAIWVVIFRADPAIAQIDQDRAAMFFKEAAALCELEGGRLWGVSLCGPMVFGDAATNSIATNQAAPSAPRPQFLGIMNAPAEWGGVRWSMIAWQTILPMDQHNRGRLMVHELFHRIQPQLGFMIGAGANTHLETLNGRFWMQLEWRALAKALNASGNESSRAIRDALAFRGARRRLFPGAAENERGDEIREGLAQYTGTVTSTASMTEAVASATKQLEDAPLSPSFVATFGYWTGVSYGLLLDRASPGWTRRLKPTDDLSQLLMDAARLQPAGDAEASAIGYGSAEIRAAEERRETEHNARVAELRRRFVDRPVLILPGVNSSFSITTGRTSIPGAGIIYPQYRTTAEWGSLEADPALVPEDRTRIVVPAPASIEGRTLRGDGWTLTLAPGWVIEAGDRPGDFRLIRERRQ